MLNNLSLSRQRESDRFVDAETPAVVSEQKSSAKQEKQFWRFESAFFLTKADTLVATLARNLL